MKLHGRTRLRLDGLDEGSIALRQHRVAANRDVVATYGRFGAVEVRLDRIDRRLELTSEPAE